VLDTARRLVGAGFTLIATRGTAAYLRAHGLEVETINKVAEGSPHIVDALRRGAIAMVINTPQGYGPNLDSFSIRRSALECRVRTLRGGGRSRGGSVELLQREATDGLSAARTTIASAPDGRGPNRVTSATAPDRRASSDGCRAPRVPGVRCARWGSARRRRDPV